MKQFITGPSVPTAQICINKSRLKIHNKETDPTYYLKSGQEFQMEFHNPTKDTIMARIYLNGKAITQGGLVLRPAERVFLERYFDVAKKFLFETYDVANTNEAKEAIENNGDFRVEFFKESTPLTNYWNGNISFNNCTGTAQYPHQYPHTLTNTSSNINGILRSSSLSAGISNTTLASAGGNVNVGNSMNLASMDALSRSSSQESLSDSYKSMGFCDMEQSRPIKKLSKKTIETGRVEQGGYSDQKIKTVNKNFDTWSFHTVEYKMLPISQKINTSADINVAQYCVNCGSKTGKTDRFCAKCGTKI